MSDSNATTLEIQQMGSCDYQQSFEAMRQFTEQRQAQTSDQLWLLQHFPVFTQGKAGKAEHILKKSDIPVIQSDRGGQITYHGPGQIIVYFLIDLHRRKINIRQLLDVIEQSIITLLASYQIQAHTIDKQPGVYVNQQKISSLGLHIQKGCSYHGLSLNVDMDLTPFSYINACGIAGLKVTQMADLGCKEKIDQVSDKLLAIIQHNLNQLH